MVNNRKNDEIDEKLSAASSISFTKAEVNFLILPYFCLDKEPDLARNIEVIDMQQRCNEMVETVWTVLPHPDFGLPRDFERRLQRAIEYSMSSMSRPISNPVPLPGFRELARMMGVTYTGRFTEKVKHGLTAMMRTAIISKRSYYNKTKKAWTEEKFHLYDKIIFKGKRKRSTNPIFTRDFRYAMIVVNRIEGGRHHGDRKFKKGGTGRKAAFLETAHRGLEILKPNPGLVLPAT